MVSHRIAPGLRLVSMGQALDTPALSDIIPVLATLLDSPMSPDLAKGKENKPFVVASFLRLPHTPPRPSFYPACHPCSFPERVYSFAAIARLRIFLISSSVRHSASIALALSRGSE